LDNDPLGRPERDARRNDFGAPVKIARYADRPRERGNRLRFRPKIEENAESFAVRCALEGQHVTIGIHGR
jgi:hypothetical protein